MADSSKPAGSGNTALAFIVGGIVVGLAIIAFVVFSNGAIGTSDRPDVSVDIALPRPELPRAPELPPLRDLAPPTIPGPEPAPEA